MEIHRVTEWYKLENCKGLSKRENKNPLNSLTLSYSSVIIFRQRFHFMPIFTGSFFPSAFQSYFLFYYEFQCFASYLLHFFFIQRTVFWAIFGNFLDPWCLHFSSSTCFCFRPSLSSLCLQFSCLCLRFSYLPSLNWTEV